MGHYELNERSVTKRPLQDAFIDTTWFSSPVTVSPTVYFGCRMRPSFL